MPALTAHSTLTRLDLGSTARDEGELVVGVLSSALARWPRLASLRLEQRMYESAPAVAVVSNLLAPALYRATALTSLDVSGELVTPELAHVVGALTQLAELHLKESSRVREATPDCASLSCLRIFCGPTAIGVDQPACIAALRGIAACGSLLHLDLCDDLCPGCDLAGLELAMLPRLESIRLSWLHDSSLRQAGYAAPFVVNDPSCRYGVRALPHLLQLTSLQITGFVWTEVDGVRIDAVVEARALGAALPLLSRLAHLHQRSCVCALSGYLALAAGWCCAPALRALTCTIHSDVTLVHGARASAMQLRRLTSLEVTIDQLNDDHAEIVGDVRVSHLPWLSGQVAQLSGLRALCIHYHGDPFLAVLPTLAALSAVAGLRRLELRHADLTGADWGAVPLCALTALCLSSCHAPLAMAALASRTELLRLQLFNNGLQPGDVSTFVQRRGHALAGAPAPSPYVDLDLSGEPEAVTDAVLEELLGAAERLGLRCVHVPHDAIRKVTRAESAVGAVAAFNKRWGRQRKCVYGC